MQCTVTLRVIPVLVLAQLGTLGLIQAQPKNQEHWVATWATAHTLVRQTPARPPATPADAPPRAGARPHPKTRNRGVPPGPPQKPWAARAPGAPPATRAVAPAGAAATAQ